MIGCMEIPLYFYSTSKPKKLTAKQLTALKLQSEEGEIESSIKLGKFYLEDSKNLDHQSSLKYFKIAADKGDENALKNVAYLLRNGKGVETNLELSFEYYKKAADLGEVEAMQKLGDLYERGTGVKRNVELAIHYYQLASEKGNHAAMQKLGDLYKRGEGVEQSYQEALKYFLQSESLGNSNAMLRLGEMYSSGRGVEKDEKKAFKYFKKASDLGNKKAHQILAKHYMSGDVVKENPSKALEYVKKNPTETSLQTLLKLSEENKISSPDLLKYLKQLAKNGMVAAIKSLAIINYEGKLVQQNVKEAFKYASKEEVKEDAEILKLLGDLHFEGKG